MKLLSKIALFFFLSKFLLAPLHLESTGQLYVEEGQLINSGLMLRTKKGIVEFASHAFSKDFAELATKKVKILCAKTGRKCKPVRYDFEPYLENENVPDWTLKPIPRYITRGKFAFNPQVAPDGGKMFWTTLIQQGSQGRSTQKIWTSEKDEYGFWKPGWQMESPLNNQMPSAVISVLPGGNELFIFGNFGEDELMNDLRLDMERKALALQESKNQKEYQYKMNQLKLEHKRRSQEIFNRAPLYKSYRTKTYWTAPSPIRFPGFYNTYKKPSNPNQQIFGGSALSSSGKILIFSAQQKANYGKLDLYVSFMNSKGEFEPAINMGNEINTTEEEMAPFLAPDDRTLYFSSSGYGDDLSIYVSKRIGDSWTKWSKPREISSKLRGVNFFSIPASSQWAYVSRDGVLYTAKIPGEYRPENVVIIQGKVVDSKGNPLEAKVKYESLTKQKLLGKGISDPKTGSFSLILPYGENYGFFAEKEGYLPVSVNVKLDQANSEQNAQEKTVELVLPKIEKGTELTLNNLFFPTGSSDLAKESTQELNRIASILKTHTKLIILLEGHTDDVGSDASNKTLSESRAESVKKYLVEKGGIAKDRIRTLGMGSGKPVAPNDTEENRRKNRRVVFKIEG